MSKSDAFENDLLKLIFNGTAIANIADNAASSPLTQLYVSLHTADPGEGGTQSTSETTYTGYSRVGVPRTTAGWVVTTNAGVTSVSPANTISFPQCTAGTATITHFSIGLGASGTSKVLYKGTVTPQVAIASGVTPQLTTASTISEE